jgi:hypothetical protein
LEQGAPVEPSERQSLLETGHFGAKFGVLIPAAAAAMLQILEVFSVPGILFPAALSYAFKLTAATFVNIS